MKNLVMSAVAFVVLSFATSARPAEIKVVSSNALKTVLDELGPEFQRSSGHTLAITWGTAAGLKTDIENGAEVDVAILTDTGVDELIKKGKLASRVALARSGIGIAIRRGGAKPELKSLEEFKKMLLEAKSIAWVEQGASAAYLTGVFDRLGIADQIKPKIKPVQSAGEAVANGEAEIGLTQVSEILEHKGAELAGMLPPDVQKFTTFAAGVRSQDSEPSAAFLKFLATPTTAAVIKAKGLEPL